VRRTLRAGLRSLAVAALLPGAATAQVYWGAHAVHAADAFGGATGAGVRAGVDLPVLPFDLIGSAEYFFPDCGNDQSDCSLHGLTLDANLRMVIPVVRPYAVAGLSHRRASAGDDAPDQESTGLALGAGVDVALGGVRLFGEGRYEFLDAPERQFLWRLGVLFGL
jgi:hypothetical protein